MFLVIDTPTIRYTSQFCQMSKEIKINVPHKSCTRIYAEKCRRVHGARRTEYEYTPEYIGTRDQLTIYSSMSESQGWLVISPNLHKSIGERLPPRFAPYLPAATTTSTT